MATSGSFYTTSYVFSSGDRYLRFNWSVVSQSIVSRQTVISWEVVGDGTYKYNPKCGNFTIKIDGETVYTSSDRINVLIGTVIASGTKTFTHDENGYYTFSAYVEAGIYTYAVNCSGSGSFDLPRIPQKSTLTVANGTLGTAQKITVNRDDSSLTHTITYTCGSASGTICTNSSNTSISWTPSNELAKQAPSANSVSVVFKIVTYSGSTEIGSSTSNITCSIPYTNTFIPVLAYTTSDAMGHADKYGAYVQGQSKLNVAITTYGAYGAWITSIKTTFNGATYTEDNVTTNLISKAGTLSLSVTVTDSRGRTTTAESSITVLAYEYPQITALSATRSDANGNADSAGAYMAVRFSTVVVSLNNKNKAIFAAAYKAVTAESYTELDTSTYDGQYTVTNGLVVFPAETSSSYDVLFSVYDDFMTTTKSVSGSSVKKVMSFLKKNGEIVGMAVGKVAEHENVFEVGWQVKFATGDTVIEQGEQDGWTYRKWDSGVAECWKIHAFSTTISTAFGSLYCGNATPRLTYPFAFVEKPVENVTLQSGSTQAFLYVESGGYGVNGTNASARYNVFRPGSMADSQTFYLSFHVIGKWK